MLKKAENRWLPRYRSLPRYRAATVRERSLVWRAIALACLCVLGVSAQSLETLAASYRKAPSPRTRAAVLHFADLHRNDRSGALAFLVLGATEVEQRQFGDGLRHLSAAGKRLPQLADYVGYLSATAQWELRQLSDVEGSLEPVWRVSPASPLVSKAVVLQATASLDDTKPADAITLVGRHLADLPASHAELLLARAYEQEENSIAAAAHYQRIYVEFPLSGEASNAEAALSRYPAPPPHALLMRGLKLVEGGDYSRAAKELTALLPQLSGPDADMARVRIAAARYLARDNKPAYEYLRSFQASTPESEAERLYYLLDCARRLDHIDEMNATLEQLTRAHPQSHWRFQAVVSVANYYSAHDQPQQAEPLYRTCYESFPNEPQSAPCQWKVAWATYLRDPSGAADLFQEHLKQYPDFDRVSSALYFLGRIAESKSDWGAARVYYEQINSGYPNYYYAILARERLQRPTVGAAERSPDAVQFLNSVPFPKRRDETFEASATTKQRIERAHLLASAGLDDLMEGELRFGAKADGQSQIMALELADLAARRDAPDQGIRYIKHYAPDYLSMRIDTAPDKFWRLAFPMPYQKALEEYSRQHSLDPYLVAALIRQESEFNPKALSRSNARGLTQVMPATGRQVSRQLGMRGFRPNMLYSPDTNLKIGTAYLKTLSDQIMGEWEATLASYNAGKSHVNAWLASANFREPAEFVESIPFNETRVYVQSVLRNAEVYRRIYSPKAR
jgi:soluble lytic murein transglycosylase